MALAILFVVNDLELATVFFARRECFIDTLKVAVEADRALDSLHLLVIPIEPSDWEIPRGILHIGDNNAPTATMARRSHNDLFTHTIEEVFVFLRARFNDATTPSLPQNILTRFDTLTRVELKFQRLWRLSFG